MKCYITKRLEAQSHPTLQHQCTGCNCSPKVKKQACLRDCPLLQDAEYPSLARLYQCWKVGSYSVKKRTLTIFQDNSSETLQPIQSNPTQGLWWQNLQSAMDTVSPGRAAWKLCHHGVPGTLVQMAEALPMQQRLPDPLPEVLEMAAGAVTPCLSACSSIV